MSFDLTFITNEPGKHLRDRFAVLSARKVLDEHNPGSWPNVFRDFGVRGHLCESIGKLPSPIRPIRPVCQIRIQNHEQNAPQRWLPDDL